MKRQCYSCWKCMTLEQKICYICEYEYEYFLSKPNIVGVGFGYEVKNGFYTENKCIKMFAIKKIPENKLPVQHMIPKLYKGIKTDVVESGMPKALKLTKRVRPAIGGYSIAPINTNLAGTLGCLATDGHYNYILSNNHVLSDDNTLPVDRTPIIQPAEIDGGSPTKDIIAVLSKFVPIKFISLLKSPTNYVDCAIAKVIDKSMVSSKIAFIGEPRVPMVAKLRTEVKKVGCITEETSGIIMAINSTQMVAFENKQAIFKKQIITTPMATSGDSGSILMNDKNHVIGLFMAATESQSVCNDITYVLNALNVRLVTN